MISPLPPIIDDLLADPDVTDVLVNKGNEVWSESRGRLELRGHLDPGVIDAAFERILASTGRRLDRLHPVVDTRLPDGTRVCGVVPPIAVDGTCAAFRSFSHRVFDLHSFTPCPRTLERLVALVNTRRNVLVSGATGAGKTSLLASLVAQVTHDERLVILEDTAELVIGHPHVLRLECRPPTPEGRGGVDLETLVRTSLRLRPDRLVVGEIRGPEALALVDALNTGHLGSLATMHANSASDARHRLGLLLRRATTGLDRTTVDEMIAMAIHAIVHVERTGDGRRVVSEIEHLDSGLE